VKGGEVQMAQATLIDSNLRLVFETGLNEKGEPIHKSKMYNNVKQGATVEQLFQAAGAIAALSNHPLYTVERDDRFDIIG
jgi:hypothetical protein